MELSRGADLEKNKVGSIEKLKKKKTALIIVFEALSAVAEKRLGVRRLPGEGAELWSCCRVGSFRRSLLHLARLR